MKETFRIETFSDGIFAIVVTLLGLELKVPPPGEASLAPALAAAWPEYLAFALSFATVGIIWLNHHRLFIHIHRADHGLLLLNGLLLMVVTAVPFSTSLLAEYLGHTQGRTAALVYSGNFLLVTAAFSAVWRYASRRRHLVDRHVEPELARRIDVRLGISPLLYLASFTLAFFSMAASVTTDLAVTFLLALPLLPARREGVKPR